MKDEALAERCRRLRLVLTDVDGVLTDGRVWLLPGGEELKGFHSRDGLGITLARRAGLQVGFLSGRRSYAVEARARELGVTIVRQGVSDKPAELRELLASEGLTGTEVAYMGDDVIDVGVMAEVALSAAPADAPFEVRAQAFMITQARGGEGCFREFLEAILRARGDWERVAGV
jgi:3-deoxy-D-manno-octulosonate 8-phosphate phosphatase (KDO 8-P phosphatase)